MIRYLDVCSGYSAFTLASAGLGFRCVGYSEIEAFPRAVLEQRHGAAVQTNLIGHRRWSALALFARAFQPCKDEPPRS